MQLKTFFSKDKKVIKNCVSSFIKSATKVTILSIMYDANYATKEWRARVYYVKTKV